MNDQSISRGNRQSGIELLCIFATIGVIFQHYNSPHIGGAIRFASQDSGKMFVLTITHVIMICAVDLFILITGYHEGQKEKGPAETDHAAQPYQSLPTAAGSSRRLREAWYS